MFPNPLDCYNAGMKWALPSLLAALFLYHFVSNHFSARVQQHWLDRLQARGKVEQPPRELASALSAHRIGVLERCKQLLVRVQKDR